MLKGVLIISSNPCIAFIQERKVLVYKRLSPENVLQQVIDIKAQEFPSSVLEDLYCVVSVSPNKPLSTLDVNGTILLSVFENTSTKSCAYLGRKDIFNLEMLKKVLNVQRISAIDLMSVVASSSTKAKCMFLSQGKDSTFLYRVVDRKITGLKISNDPGSIAKTLVDSGISGLYYEQGYKCLDYGNGKYLINIASFLDISNVPKGSLLPNYIASDLRIIDTALYDNRFVLIEQGSKIL